jgi:branched-chain amino acid transport system substrate-binding protein
MRALLASLALLGASCLVGTAAAQQIKIAVGVPLSGSDAIYGAAIRLGVEQAVADIDADGGFLGQKARVVVGDDGGDPKKAVAVAKGFIAAKIPFVVGHLSSATTMPTSALYADAGLLDITPTAIAPAITARGLSTVFRICGREDQQAAVAAQWLVDHHIGRIAIVHDRTPTGKDLADATRKALAARGTKEVFYGSIEKGSHDVAALAGRIKASGAQVVLWGGGPTEAGLLVRELKDANARATLLGGFGIASDEFASLAGSAADGSMIVFPRDPRTRPAAADLLRRLKAKGTDPKGGTFYAYAAVQVIQQAAAASRSLDPKALDPKALAATMHAGTVFHTVLGDLSFDQAGDPIASDLAVYVWHKGPSGRMGYNDLAGS